MAAEWTPEELRKRFEHLLDVCVTHGSVQVTLDTDDLRFILGRGRHATPCTCELVSPGSPWDPAEYERDLFCPAHHLDMDQLREMYQEARSWMPDK